MSLDRNPQTPLSPEAQRQQHRALAAAACSGLVALVTDRGTDATGHRVLAVPSGSRQVRHLVRVTAAGEPVSCTCEAWTYRQRACKHMAAAWLHGHPAVRVRLSDGRAVDPRTGEVTVMASVTPVMDTAKIAVEAPMPTWRQAA